MPKKEFGVKWDEFSRMSGRLQAKEQFFQTELERSRFLSLILEKGNFNMVLSWTNPEEPGEENWLLLTRLGHMGYSPDEARKIAADLESGKVRMGDIKPKENKDDK